MKQVKILISIALTCVFIGIGIGMLTNMINGAISPLYFRNIMHWENVHNIWKASVTQGIFEGGIYGIIFAVVFTIVVGVVTKGDVSYSTVCRFLAGLAITVLICWCLGGGFAILLALSSPEFYQHTFRGVPSETLPMIRYAWVGGSIWGAMFGCLFSLTIGLVVFKLKWNKNSNKVVSADG